MISFSLAVLDGFLWKELDVICAAFMDWEMGNFLVANPDVLAPNEMAANAFMDCMAGELGVVFLPVVVVVVLLLLGLATTEKLENKGDVTEDCMEDMGDAGVLLGLSANVFLTLSATVAGVVAGAGVLMVLVGLKAGWADCGVLVVVVVVVVDSSPSE